MCKVYRPRIPAAYLKQCLMFYEPDGEGLPVDEKNPDPSNFEGFLHFCKTVRNADGEIEAKNSYDRLVEVQRELDTRKDFHEEGGGSTSPSPPPAASF